MGGLVFMPTVQAEDSPVENLSTAPTIVDANLSGEGYIDNQHEIVQDHPGTPFLWQDGEVNITTTVESGEVSGDFRLCARGYNEEGEALNLADCRVFSMENHSREVHVVNLSGWHEDATGNHSIVLELSIPIDGQEEVIADFSGDVYILERDGDYTGDGLSNYEEVEHGTDFTVPDTSGNGLTDWEEVKKWGTDPLALDTTGDGINDATLVRFGLDPTDPYVAHRYGLVLFLFLATMVAGTGIAIHRFRGYRRSGEPTQTYGAAYAENGPQGNPPRLPDESILTREEYVCELLERNEDRMRQRQIVDATGWSKAKVSRVLTGLEDDGEIRKIQVGRENVIERTPGQTNEH